MLEILMANGVILSSTTITQLMTMMVRVGAFVLCDCSSTGRHQHCHQPSGPSHLTALTAAALNC